MAMIADALASQFAESLVTMAKEEVTMMLNVKGDLRQLEKRMVFIRSVLEDAEHKALGNTAHTNANDIRVWLADLKDVLYDAVDVIDLRRTRVEQLKRLSSNWRSVPCYSCLFSFSFCVPRIVFRYQTGYKIRSINGRLEGIRKDQSDFGLIAAATARDDHGSSSRSHRQTSCLLEPDIVGMQIENDTTHLVDLLVKEYRVPAPAVSVLAIVGMGGIGKTTLAQKVFNHPTIKNKFSEPPPMWICVSQDYSDTNILEKVIRCAGGDHSRAQSFSELHLLLAQIIEQKKFFLILDDVWDARVWEDILRTPLQKAVAGTMILITTRFENVAKSMGAAHLHRVQALPAQDGWLLLSNKVLRGGKGGLEAVEDIGVQIVKKCQGLPLAIKTIAEVLRVKERTRPEWQKVLDNPAWSSTNLPHGGGVMGALYLSYQDLPSHLKQCFVFCSLFPEDYEMGKNMLIQYWIAHGFVKAGEDAEDCYKELLSRSLLQPVPGYFHYSQCTMHDLLRTLGQFLAGEDNFTGDVEGWLVKASASAKIRHLYLIDHNNQLDSVPDHESLRTLHLESRSLVDLAPHVFKKLWHLRVFELKCPNVRKLPDTVQNLVLLRVLNLTWIRELPDSIGSLINLQMLGLSSSSITELPDSIGSLSNLQMLDLSSTWIKELPESIGSLSNLQNLDLSTTRITKLPEIICSLSNLQNLNLSHTTITELRESIGSLSNLQNLDLSTTRITKLPEIIGSLSNLQNLDLSHTTITELPESIGSLSNLQNLDLSTTRITTLPEIIGSLSNLQNLFLSTTEITELPKSIGSLRNLQNLYLSRTKITELPESIGRLSNLQMLDLSHTNITELPESIGSLRNLQNLFLSPTTITELPESIGSLSNLQKLDLSFTPITKLPESIGSLSNLQNLELKKSDITKLPESIGSLSNLQMLYLYKAPITELPKSIGSLSNLQMLYLFSAPITELPESIGSLSNLQKLNLSFTRITKLPESIGSLSNLQNLDLSHGYITKLPESIGGLSNLQNLDLSCTPITELPESIGCLSNLQYLILQSCYNLHSLPKGVTELYNLRDLNLINIRVEGMPTGIGRLQHLKYLYGFVTNESISGNGRWCSMEELRSLTQLSTLQIEKLERAVVVVKARGFLLKDMRHLNDLRLYCSTLTKDGMQVYAGEKVERIQKIFEEELYPPNSLETLQISSFFGFQFPSWMTSDVLSNLKQLWLKNCHLWEQLPPLGQLPNLDTLTIRGASAVEIVGAYFFGARPSPYNYIPFPKLVILKLDDFPNWAEWSWEHEDDGVTALPHLQKLELTRCPRLRSLPKGLLCHTKLHTLIIDGADSLTAVENLMCIKKLEIKNNPNLVRLSNLPALQELLVEACPALRDMGVLYSLKKIEFKDLPVESSLLDWLMLREGGQQPFPAQDLAVESSLPDWLMLREGGQQPFPALELLHITVGGVPMLQRCCQGGPDWPKIQHFSSVRIEVYGRPEFLFYSRDPFTLDINMGADNGDGSGGSEIQHHG